MAPAPVNAAEVVWATLAATPGAADAPAFRFAVVGSVVGLVHVARIVSPEFQT